MDNAIDQKGRKINYKDAIKGNQYLCPYCTESLILRKGKKPCFAHMPIKERTPLQRTCPEYNENESNYGRIENISDIVYIDNGGVPLYLCNDGNRFEIRAYFPSISEESKKSLDKNSKVIIDNKEWCYVENLSYYPVYNIKKWIDVALNTSKFSNEIKRKWLWGIRGIDIQKDIYYANSEGGYRVAIKSNIYINKVYRIMFLNSVPYINGIKFEKIGEIRLKEMGREKVFSIYEMFITEYNEESRQFIESKGYNLIKKMSKVIPLWPPAIFNGNELTFDNDKAWFYHSRKNDDEYVYEINGGRMYRLGENNILAISNISSINEKAIVVTNKLINDQKLLNASAEIKYIVSYRQNLNNKNFIKPEIVLKDSNSNIIDINSYENIHKGEKYNIESNIPLKLLIVKNNYCIYSSICNLDGLTHGSKIVIDFKGFGNMFLPSNNDIEFVDKINEFDWKLLYKQLYKCTGKKLICSHKEKLILYKIKNNINKQNREIYDILYGWIRDGKIPADAKLIIDRIGRGY